MINLTVTETEGDEGFVAVFPANVVAGNSSINWTTANQNIANGVIAAMDHLVRSRFAVVRRVLTS